MPCPPLPVALALLEGDTLRLRHGAQRTGSLVRSGPVSDDPYTRHSYAVRAAKEVGGRTVVTFTANTRCASVSSIVTIHVVVDPERPTEAAYLRRWTSGADELLVDLHPEERAAMDAWLSRQDLVIGVLRWTLNGPRKVIAPLVGADEGGVRA